jgi:hypothetical protein
MTYSMKPHALLSALLLSAALLCRAADAPIRLDPMPGSKVRIEGTSSIHDWQVEGKLIGGYLEAGPGFPLEPGQTVATGKVDAKVQAFIPVRSLTSIEKDGKPYSTKMDDIMYEKLLQPTSPRITYRLEELVLKQLPKTPDAPFVFEAKGSLIVAGATNSISMPVNVTTLGAKKLKISGTLNVKMTSFNIQPPAPAIALGLIKTGDEVKLLFDWMVGPKAAPTAVK